MSKVKLPALTVELNHCTCHPETCGCPAFVLKSGDVVVCYLRRREDGKLIRAVQAAAALAMREAVTAHLRERADRLASLGFNSQAEAVRHSAEAIGEWGIEHG